MHEEKKKRQRAVFSLFFFFLMCVCVYCFSEHIIFHYSRFFFLVPLFTTLFLHRKKKKRIYTRQRLKSTDAVHVATSPRVTFVITTKKGGENEKRGKKKRLQPPLSQWEIAASPFRDWCGHTGNAWRLLFFLFLFQFYFVRPFFFSFLPLAIHFTRSEKGAESAVKRRFFFFFSP